MAVDGFSAQLPVGSILGDRYEVHRTLATGGMGCVYLAHSRALEKWVAVKVLRQELTESVGALERFRREAWTAAQLRHPNIVQIVDFGHSDGGSPYLVMEYVQGPSVAEVVRREGPLRIERVLALMEELLGALDEMHARGIVHGDLSSANLLLQPTLGGGARLKLVDFGLARRLATVDLEVVPDGRAILFCGTPGYLAPEIIRGEKLSVAADVYSAGVVLHELLTGELPVAAASPLELMVARLTAIPLPPSLRFPRLGIPPGFDPVIARALSMDPADRFSAVELGVAIHAAARGVEPARRDARSSRGGTLVGVGPALARRTPAPREVLPVVDEAPTGGEIVRSPARHQKLRDGIGSAMRCGDVDHMVDLYLALAELLRDAGEPAAAIAELREAIDVLTLGGGENAAGGPGEMWRLLLLLAEMHALRGSNRAARACAAFAYRQAQRTSSWRGRSATLLFLRHLPLA